MDDHLGHLWWNGSRWNGWEDPGRTDQFRPRDGVMGIKPSRRVRRRVGRQSQPQVVGRLQVERMGLGWRGIPRQPRGGLLGLPPNRIDVFVRGMDDHLGHLWRG